MVENKTIKLIFNKAKSGGYKFIFITDEIDISFWESAWLPGGAFYLFQMTPDRKTTERISYYSLFDIELAKAIFGEDYKVQLQSIIESGLPPEIYLRQFYKNMV